MMPGARRLWLIAFVAGLAMMLVGLGFGQFAGLQHCTPPPGVSPIIALEMARSATEAMAVLTGAECRSAQHDALWLDALGFIPAYALMLIGGVLAAGSGAAAGGAARAMRWGLGAVVLAALLDQVEGGLLFRILAMSDMAKANTGTLFALLFGVVRAKFLALQVVLCLIGWLLARHRDMRLLPGVLIAGAGLLSHAGLDLGNTPMMMGAMTAGFLALVVTAMIALIARPRD